MRVLGLVAEQQGFTLERTTYDWGTERYLDEGAMLFDHLACGESAVADDLRGAVEAQLADEDAPRTPDLGGEAGTMDVIPTSATGYSGTLWRPVISPSS